MSGGKFESHGLRCYIFSRSLPGVERDFAIFVREEPKRLVEELRKKKGRDIWLAGGGELTREAVVVAFVSGIAGMAAQGRRATV